MRFFQCGVPVICMSKTRSAAFFLSYFIYFLTFWMVLAYLPLVFKAYHFTDQQIYSQIKAAYSVPIDEEKPKVLAFLCNWCSYGAADLAGVSRFQYPPNFRIIRVPCSGRVSPKFILAAFRHGSDGVWVSG